MDGMRLGGAFREARRRKELSQTRVGVQIEAHQSQVSSFERGRLGALSEDKIQRFADLVDLDLEEARLAANAQSGLCYCSDPECLGVLPIWERDEVRLRPHFAETGHRFCGMCGGVTESSCPRCEADLEAGYYCPSCGEPYVEPPERMRHASKAQVEAEAARRARLASFDPERQPFSIVRGDAG